MNTDAGTRIVLASNNRGKLVELSDLLGECGITVIPQAALGVTEAVEDGLSFVENAIIKARNAAHQAGLPAIADDSGIEVDWLNGAPGIYSARFAGVGASDTENLERLLERLEGVPECRRTARYRCVVVYMRHDKDPMPLVAQGTWEGQIVSEPRGENGFGYDPIFYVPDLGQCAAELAPEVKNALSHRGQALAELARVMTRRGPGNQNATEA